MFLRKCSFLKCKRCIQQSKECVICTKLTLEPLEYTTDLYLTEDKTKLKYNLYTIKPLYVYVHNHLENSPLLTKNFYMWIEKLLWKERQKMNELVITIYKMCSS